MFANALWSDRDISQILRLKVAVEMMQNGTVVGRKRGISKKIEVKDSPNCRSNLPRKARACTAWLERQATKGQLVGRICRG